MANEENTFHQSLRVASVCIECRLSRCSIETTYLALDQQERALGAAVGYYFGPELNRPIFNFIPATTIERLHACINRFSGSLSATLGDKGRDSVFRRKGRSRPRGKQSPASQVPASLPSQ